MAIVQEVFPSRGHSFSVFSLTVEIYSFSSIIKLSLKTL